MLNLNLTQTNRPAEDMLHLTTVYRLEGEPFYFGCMMELFCVAGVRGRWAAISGCTGVLLLLSHN